MLLKVCTHEIILFKLAVTFHIHVPGFNQHWWSYIHFISNLGYLTYTRWGNIFDINHSQFLWLRDRSIVQQRVSKFVRNVEKSIMTNQERAFLSFYQISQTQWALLFDLGNIASTRFYRIASIASRAIAATEWKRQ